MKLLHDSALPQTMNDIGLAELIAAFGERYRGIGVRIQEMVPHEQQAALLARRIDIGFLRRPRREPDLVSEIAWRENVGLALPENLVFLRRADSQFAQYLQNCCIEAGFMPRISYEVVESYSLISLVAAGLGVAIVPESLRKLSRPGVVYRRFEAPAPIADVEMTYRPDSTKVIKRFVGLAREVLTPSRRSASLQSNGKPFRDAIVS
jgi:DNA-binding transcriptional LysR family regulator